MLAYPFLNLCRPKIAKHNLSSSEIRKAPVPSYTMIVRFSHASYMDSSCSCLLLASLELVGTKIHEPDKPALLGSRTYFWIICEHLSGLFGLKLRTGTSAGDQEARLVTLTGTGFGATDGSLRASLNPYGCASTQWLSDTSLRSALKPHIYMFMYIHICIYRFICMYTYTLM